MVALASLALVSSPAAATGSKATTTVLTSSVPALTGAPITFTATVTHNVQTPTGTVTFTIVGADSSTPVCDGGSDTINLTPASTGSEAQCSFSAGLFAAASPYQVTASYSGDSTFAPSSAGPTPEVIHLGSTTTAVTASSNPTVTGEGVTFTAVVAPVSPSTGVPTGTVTFAITGHDGSTVNCDDGDMPTLDANDMAQCAVSAGLFAAGSPYTVTASYSGDKNYHPSTGTATQGVAKATTTVTVMSSASTLVTGQAVTFTANIAVNPPGSGTPTGNVVFSLVSNNGGPPLTATCMGGDTQPISSLSATCSVPAGLQGKGLSYTVSATLSDPNFKSPVAGTLVQPVSKAATTTTLMNFQGSYLASQGFSFGVQIQTATPGMGAPIGVVEYAICLNGAAQCTAQDGTVGNSYVLPAPNAKDVTNNRNRITINVPEGLSPGFWDVVANYEGNGNLSASTNTDVGHIEVTTVPTTMELFLNHNPVKNEGKLVIKTAIIPDARASGSLGAPSGTVTFTITGADSSSDTLTCDSGSNVVNISTNVNNQGLAKCVIDAGQLMNANAPYAITAAYSGDSDYAAVSGTGNANVASP
ncbi:MAG TPA: Ig-like domain repeat protein [Acidimicrobiales bacterium]|nr:Ig-like domain repeat protein [Acidimicrobiales bacterium]